jgi:hypothetical protein
LPALAARQLAAHASQDEASFAATLSDTAVPTSWQAHLPPPTASRAPSQSPTTASATARPGAGPPRSGPSATGTTPTIALRASLAVPHVTWRHREERHTVPDSTPSKAGAVNPRTAGWGLPTPWRVSRQGRRSVRKPGHGGLRRTEQVICRTSRRPVAPQVQVAGDSC